jgi:hypothetical protein
MGVALPIKGYATDELLFYQPVVLLLFHRGHFKNHKEPFSLSQVYCFNVSLVYHFSRYKSLPQQQAHRQLDNKEYCSDR